MSDEGRRRTQRHEARRAEARPEILYHSRLGIVDRRQPVISLERVRTADSGLALRLEVPCIRGELAPLDGFWTQLRAAAAALVVPAPDIAPVQRLLTRFARELRGGGPVTIEVLIFVEGEAESYAVAHELRWLPQPATARVGLDPSLACQHSWRCAAFRTNSLAGQAALRRHLSPDRILARVEGGVLRDCRPSTVVALTTSGELVIPADRCELCRDLLAGHLATASGALGVDGLPARPVAVTELAGAWVVDPEHGIGELTAVGDVPIRFSDAAARLSRALAALVSP